MNKMIKAFYKFAYKYRLIPPVKIAAKLGVRCGNKCRFLDDPTLMFGSEPYLIRCGNHVEVTNGCRFITHDGSAWVFRMRGGYMKKSI